MPAAGAVRTAGSEPVAGAVTVADAAAASRTPAVRPAAGALFEELS
ncbi:hypothetical protein [Streptomyces sp. NPDC059398]